MHVEFEVTCQVRFFTRDCLEVSLLALGEVRFVFAVSQEQDMRGEEECLENMYIKCQVGEHSMKGEIVWVFLYKAKLQDPAVTLVGIYTTDLKT